MIRFSLRFNNDLPVRTYMALAQTAEAAGFDQLWVSNDLFLRGVWPILSAAAMATERIELGTCIVNPYTTHPAEIVMQAAALDELSNGRMLLGVSAGAAEFLDWVGVPQKRPLTITDEAIRRMRDLLAGMRGPWQGVVWPDWGPAAYMRFPTRRIPIYLGATSPRMHRLIGSLADGGLPLLFPPESYTQVAERVAAGAAESGRDPAGIDLAACIWVSLDDNAAAAEAALRDRIAYYANAMSDEVLAAVGVDRATTGAIAQALRGPDGLKGAAALVPPELLRIGVAGDAAGLIRRLEDLVAAGARHLSFGPPLGPDPIAAIAALGRDVLPHFAHR
ncbi:MAG: LLM class flavin-dependent oxidoreductase [Oscillochloris sp.]|nr:LLM class flavin-dependent oxidoreductase [Oscillochloris sp.]